MNAEQVRAAWAFLIEALIWPYVLARAALRRLLRGAQ